MPFDLRLSCAPILPLWLILLLAASLLALLVHGSRVLLHKGVVARWVGWLAALRVVIILLMVLALLQPVVAYRRTTERRPAMLILLDTSQSMDQRGGGGKGSRLEDVVPPLQSGALARALERGFDLKWFAFDRTAVLIEKSDLGSLQATGDSTQYADSLTAAWNQLVEEGTGSARPERVLLVSDGRDQGQTDLADLAQRLGLAVDVLPPGSPPETSAPARIAIREVQAARRVLLGSETQFQVALQFDRAAGDRQAQLILSENGTDIQTRMVTVGRGRTEALVHLAHRPTATGSKTYQFRLQVAGQDQTAPYTVGVQVVDGKNEVLILEDSWRWEFKYLRRVLEDDPSFRFTALLARGGGTFMQFASPDRRLPLIGFPQNKSQLARLDVLILGDVDPRRWPRGLGPAVRDLVADDGRSLVVLAGPNLLHWLEVPDLLALLPVEISRETAAPLTGPVSVRLSAEGSRSPLFFQTVGRTTEFPALDQIYPPLRKKPAATVLVEAAQQANAYGPLIVMAEQTVGRGRVVFIGTDTLWKWQTMGPSNEAQATIHRLFWQQALRALAPPRAASGAVNIWLQPDHTRYETGQRVLVRAAIDSAQALAQRTLQGGLTWPDGKHRPLAFALDASSPGKYVAEFEAAAAGSYQIQAAVLAGDRALADSVTTIDVTPLHGEVDGSPVDRANLARLAASTGGVVVDPYNSATWPQSDLRQWEPLTVARTLDLWQDYTLLLALCLLLGIDWVVRLVRGYV
jgi:hypothetical protein